MNTPILEILAYLISTAGAGAAASQLFDQLRTSWNSSVPLVSTRADRFINSLVNTRAGARIAVFALSAVISVFAAGLLAHLTGQPLGPSIEKALYAALASQVYHVKSLLGQAPAGELVVFTPEER